MLPRIVPRSAGPRERKDDEDDEQSTDKEQEQLTKFETADFCLLKFFEKCQRAEFNRSQFSKIEKVEDDREWPRRPNRRAPTD